MTLSDGRVLGGIVDSFSMPSMANVLKKTLKLLKFSTNLFFNLMVVSTFFLNKNCLFSLSSCPTVVEILTNAPSQGLLQPGHITCSKNFKTPFFGDIFSSCQWVTQMGLEPQQNFSFLKISKNKAASPVLSFLLFWWEIHV